MPVSRASASLATYTALFFAAVKLVLQLVALEPYGYFRDELYYLACANHLALGYVDHPPFSIAVLAAWRAVFGDSIVAVRLVPAIAGAALVWTTGRLVTALGGRALATGVACLAVLCAPVLVVTDHLYSMNALDHLLWASSALCLLRALAEPRPSRWIVLGVVLGIGLLNKFSILWFGAGLAASLLSTAAGRGALRTRGPFIAAAVAAALVTPHIVWQIVHHWPTAEFARNAMEVKYVRHSLWALLGESTMLMNPAVLPVTIAGVVTPFLSPARERARPLAIIFITTLVIIAVSKSGKAEYVNGAYPLVFGSGAVWWEEWLQTSSLVRRGGAIIVALAMLAMLAVALPFGLPILSERSLIAYAKRLGIAPRTSENKELGELPQHYADMHGWPELVDAADQAWRTLTPEERGRARIWAVSGGYGPAAAIDVLGARRGLPHAIATHNNYWLWGYGSDDDGPVILLGGTKSWLEELFADVVQITTVECGYCMPYENHKPVYVARGMKRSWASVWPELKHFE